MDWGAGSRWRKALAVSLILHSIVLTGAGWLAGQILLPEPMPETLIELELTDGPEGPLLADTEPAAPADQPFVPDLPQPTPVQPAEVAEPVVPAPVVAASEMAMVAVDNSAGAASAPAAGGSAGTSAGSGVQGSGGGSSGKAGGVIPPGILSRREPNYPEQARRAGIEGTVVLKIEILANGRVGEVTIHRSSGSELLDQAAAAAVQRWRFVPAKVRETGQAIACQTTMPVVFKLKA